MNGKGRTNCANFQIFGKSVAISRLLLQNKILPCCEVHTTVAHTMCANMYAWASMVKLTNCKLPFWTFGKQPKFGHSKPSSVKRTSRPAHKKAYGRNLPLASDSYRPHKWRTVSKSKRRALHKNLFMNRLDTKSFESSSLVSHSELKDRWMVQLEPVPVHSLVPTNTLNVPSKSETSRINSLIWVPYFHLTDF